METSAEQEPEKKKSDLKVYYKYSAMALNFAAIVAVMGWLGHWLDEKAANQKPIYALVCLLVGIFAGIYQIIRVAKKED